MDSQLLKVATASDEFGVVVCVEGEVDLKTVAEFRRGLLDACRLVAPPMRVTADLTGVLFMSPGGLNVLLEADRRCRDQGTPLRVKTAHRTVSRVLEITGVDRMLDWESS